jgi:hypothetical protein
MRNMDAIPLLAPYDSQLAMALPAERIRVHHPPLLCTSVLQDTAIIPFCMPI